MELGLYGDERLNDTALSSDRLPVVGRVSRLMRYFSRFRFRQYARMVMTEVWLLVLVLYLILRWLF